MLGRLLVLLSLGLLMTTAVADAATPPILPARAYLLMDATTGRVLHQYEGHTTLPMASTTKIMTALLALEQGALDEAVTAGRKPYATGGATMWLDIGEQMTLRELLYALILESANDAGVAIAEHLAGTEERFAAWMTEKAQAIGAHQTRFINSHGLHEVDHYSTAHDLALIARYAMQNEAFRALVATEAVEIAGPRQLTNRNQLLGYYEGAIGVKNGFTEEAGLTNVAAARRGATELIAVVLGAEDGLWTSSMALLDFGFERYETLTIPAHLFRTTVDRPAGAISAAPVGDIVVTLPKGAGGLTHETVLADPSARLEQPGDRIGQVVLYHLGEEVGRAPLMVIRVTPATDATLRPPVPGAEAAPPTTWQPGPWWPAVGLGLLVIVGACFMTVGLHPLRAYVPGRS